MTHSSISYVFVYGTLRNGERNHKLLHDAKLISEQAKLTGTLYSTGQYYPAFILEGTSSVYGEVYQIDHKTLENLDELEGYQPGRKSNLYYRIKKTITTDLHPIEAWVYIFSSANEGELLEVIPFQDWKVYQWYQSFQKVKYFAYGSCMDTERIKQAGLLEQFSDVAGGGKLQAYKLAYSFPRPDGARADIIESTENNQVEGIVYNLSQNAVNYLFHREGVYGGHYRPTFIKVLLNGEIHDNVLTFTVIDKHPSTIPPVHYATEILRGAKGRVSSEYYQTLKTQLIDLGYKF